MTRKIEFAAMLLTLTVAACQPAEDSSDPSPAVATSIEVNEDSASPLEGAWRLVGIQTITSDGTTTDDTPQESLFLFTEDYYSMGYAQGEERSPLFSDPWNPSETEERERFSLLTVNAGKYELSGSQLVLLPQFALWPVVIGSQETIEFELSGDTLTLTYIDFVGADGSTPPDVEGGAKTLLRLVRQ